MNVFMQWAYRIIGAKHIYFGAVWKKFVFYAASDNDVVNGRQFYFMTILPFVVITALCIVVV
jgi:hypothetical protein